MKHLHTSALTFALLLTGCGTLLPEPGPEPVGNKTHSITLKSCQAITSPASNVQCDFTVKNLTKDANTLEIGRTTIKVQTADNSTSIVENVAFAGKGLDISSSANFVPQGQLDVQVRLSLPGGVNKIPLMKFDIGYPYYLSGDMKNVPVSGTVQALLPDLTLPGGSYTVDSRNMIVRFKDCKAFTYLLSNLQCHVTFINLQNSSRSVGMATGQFKFTVTSGQTITNDNVSFDAATYNTALQTNMAPNGTMEGYMNFTVPTSTNKIQQFDFDLGHPWYITGQYRELPIQGAVASPLPINNLPAGIYEYTSDARRLRLDNCQYSAPSVVCTFKLANYRNESRDLTVAPQHSTGVLPDGKTFAGTEVRFNNSAFSGQSSSVVLAPNGTATLQVKLNIPSGYSKISELSLNTGYPFYFGGLMKELPL